MKTTELKSMTSFHLTGRNCFDIRRFRVQCSLKILTINSIGHIRKTSIWQENLIFQGNKQV